MCHEVVVDVQGQGQLGVNLNLWSLNDSQAVRMQLLTTCTTHAYKQKQQAVCEHRNTTANILKATCKQDGTHLLMEVFYSTVFISASVIYECVCVPEAACSRAASSAGMGNVVTFTTSRLMRSCTRCKHTHTHTLKHLYTYTKSSSFTQNAALLPLTYSPYVLPVSPPPPSLQAPPLSDRNTTASYLTRWFIFLFVRLFLEICKSVQQFIQTVCAYPHVTLAIDDEQHDGA